jgi:hypothetical protein
LHSEDYELAAQFFNQCCGRGVQGSNTDFLICAAAVRRDSSCSPQIAISKRMSAFCS